MDNPNHRVNLRRRSSAPNNRRTSRSSSFAFRNARLHRSNPYIGWFRHSPPTSHSSRWSCSGSIAGLDCKMKLNHLRRQELLLRSSLLQKNSPHVGWFRHPAQSPYLKKSTTLSSLEQQLMTILKTKHPETKNLIDFYLSGHLKGGGKESEWTTSKVSLVNQYPLVESVRQVLQESSMEGTSITMKVLARLASWFLYPVAHDAESCGYSLDCSDTSSEVPFPLFDLKFLDRAPFKHDSSDDDDDDDNDDGALTSDEEDGDDDDDDDNDSNDISNSSLESSSSGSLGPHAQVELTQSGSHLDLELSVSSLAEAYYAHHAARELAKHQDDILDDYSDHRLDYAITQLDIARMARNASRHLDVQSIMSLPTITYQAKRIQETERSNHQRESKNAEEKGLTTLRKTEEEGWSWMMVKRNQEQQQREQEFRQEQFKNGKGGEYEQEENIVGSKVQEGYDDDEETDVCVICLEHFVDGDRLRVLPCNHSFHVGCIDRWLSGSQSFEECYTSGCPTCKKRPGVHNNSTTSGTDGSVPSWAFARIGNTLEKESGSLAL